jgi:hypothetical protein
MENTIITALVQEIGPILISLIMAWLAWLVRRYLRSLGDEKKLITIARMANAAIDYAEDLDKRGDLPAILNRLNLSPEAIASSSKGIQKLHIAGQWVQDELKRMGVEINEEEARKWVAAEFQKRIAGLSLTPEQLVQIQGILNVLQNIDADKLQALLTDISPAKASDAKSPPPHDLPLPEANPEPELLVLIPEPLSTLAETEPVPSSESDLAQLARQAVEYVQTLKTRHELTVPEIDIATAWMLTEVTKRGLNVTPDQISREIHRAFGNLEG